MLLLTLVFLGIIIDVCLIGSIMFMSAILPISGMLTMSESKLESELKKISTTLEKLVPLKKLCLDN